MSKKKAEKALTAKVMSQGKSSNTSNEQSLVSCLINLVHQHRRKKQKVLKDGPNDSAEKEEREDATSASIGSELVEVNVESGAEFDFSEDSSEWPSTASGAQEQKTRCVLKEAPKRRREKSKKN